jgi:hypothetical protein
MLCSPCGQPIEEGQAAIYGVERNGKLEFAWCCCHRPVGDVAVIIASNKCMEKWLRENPEYFDEVWAVLSEHESHKGDL